MADESFPLLVPIEIKHVCVKAIATVQSITLGISATISVVKMTEDNSVIDTRVYIMEGEDYANWGSDDLYIQHWVQEKLAREVS
jgi:hypothetical protein